MKGNESGTQWGNNSRISNWKPFMRDQIKSIPKTFKCNSEDLTEGEEKGGVRERKKERK